MSYPPGIHLYVQPLIGSQSGGSGLMIGSDADGLCLHAFHSKEHARSLIGRYGPHMADPSYMHSVLARVGKAQLPERSDTPDAVIKGFMAQMSLAAFHANGEDRRDTALLIDMRPRVSVCFLSPSAEEGLCVWRSPDEWHVAHFFSKTDAIGLGEELADTIPPRIRLKMVVAIGATEMPLEAARPMVRFQGHAAALIGFIFEEDQRRQSAD